LQDNLQIFEATRQGNQGRRKKSLLTEGDFFGGDAGDNKVLRSWWKKGVEVHQERGGKNKFCKPEKLFSIASS
jgi:hypothetical protein